RLL
ncbi:hypothetical protein D043_0660B, partial [Vibrio parahaemolyticus EKP-021]